MNNNILLTLVAVLLTGIFSIMALDYYNREHHSTDLANNVEQAGKNLANEIDNIAK